MPSIHQTFFLIDRVGSLLDDAGLELSTHVEEVVPFGSSIIARGRTLL